MHRRLYLTISLALILLAACSTGAAETPSAEAPPAEAALTPVTVILSYIPDVQFAPFYVGIEKGFFADRGIALTTTHDSESTAARLVAAGEQDFAVISGEQVVLARGQELPLVYVFEWYQQFPVGVAALAESGITAPADLAGRSVGVPVPEGASYIGLEALLSSANLTDSDINLEATGFTQVETLITGRAEAVVVYLSNEPVQLEAQGVDVNLMAVSDYADMVSNGIITSENVIANDPELVRAVAGGFAEALAYTIANPDEAFELSKAYVEGLGDPDVEAAQREVLNRSIDLWRAEVPGRTDAASWTATHDLLLSLGLLDQAVDLDGAYTNNFLP